MWAVPSRPARAVVRLLGWRQRLTFLVVHPPERWWLRHEDPGRTLRGGDGPLATRRAEELFDVADDCRSYELFRGELVRMNPTGARHAAVAVRIARLLDEYVEAHHRGVLRGRGVLGLARRAGSAGRLRLSIAA